MPDEGRAPQRVFALNRARRYHRATRCNGNRSVEAKYLCAERRVEPAWIDYNGHMNMAYYNVVFDQALDQVFDELGIGAAYVRDGGGSCFTVEIHVTYVQELKLDDPIRVTFQLLDWDEKRLHFFGEMYHAEEGYLAATSEQMSLHVDMATRKAGPLPAQAQQRIAQMMQRHRDVATPAQVGHVMKIPAERSKR
jgi:acyl-CoA thioester hydrolase